MSAPVTEPFLMSAPVMSPFAANAPVVIARTTATKPQAATIFFTYFSFWT